MTEYDFTQETCEMRPIPYVGLAPPVNINRIVGKSLAAGTLACGVIYGLSKAVGLDRLSFSANNASWTHKDTLKMQAGILVVTRVAEQLFDATNTEIGNSQISVIINDIFRRPVKSGIEIITEAPLAEETAFRLIPSVVADKLNPKGKTSNRWGLGIVTSLAFAALHGTKNEKGEKIYPVPQAVTGLGMWYVQRQGGYPHAISLHALNNALAMASLMRRF